MAGVCPLRASVTYAIPRNTRGLTKRANWDVEPGQLRVMHPAALIDRHGADARAIAGQDFPEQGASHGCREGRSAGHLSARHAARTENRLPPNEHAVFIGGIADRVPARVRSGEDLYVFVATVFVHLFDAPIARRDPVLENLGPEIVCCRTISGGLVHRSGCGSNCTSLKCPWRTAAPSASRRVRYRSPARE